MRGISPSRQDAWLKKAEAVRKAEAEAIPQTVDELRQRIAVLENALGENIPDRVFISDIITAISRHYDVTRTDLLSERRNKSIVRPRQVGMYLARLLTMRSLPEIGRRFGGRDHTTVLHGINAVKRLMQEDGEFARDVQAIQDKFRAP